MSIGVNIKHLRLDRRLSQRALIRETGLGATTVRQIEADRIDPRLSSVVKIADVLAVPLDALVGRQPPVVTAAA